MVLIIKGNNVNKVQGIRHSVWHMVKDAVLFMAVLPSHGAVPYTESGAQ